MMTLTTLMLDIFSSIGFLLVILYCITLLMNINLSTPVSYDMVWLGYVGALLYFAFNLASLIMTYKNDKNDINISLP